MNIQLNYILMANILIICLLQVEREIQLPIWKREVGTGYYEVLLVEYNEEWSEAVSTKVLGRLNFEIKPQKVVEPTPEPTPPTHK